MSKNPSPTPSRPERSFVLRLIFAILIIEGLALLLGYRRHDLLYHFDERKLIT
jgi:hypothetical protein